MKSYVYDNRIKELRLLLGTGASDENRAELIALLDLCDLDTMKYIRDQMYNLRLYYSKDKHKNEVFTESIQESIDILGVVYEYKKASAPYFELVNSLDLGLDAKND